MRYIWQRFLENLGDKNCWMSTEWDEVEELRLRAWKIMACVSIVGQREVNSSALQLVLGNSMMPTSSSPQLGVGSNRQIQKSASPPSNRHCVGVWGGECMVNVLQNSMIARSVCERATWVGHAITVENVSTTGWFGLMHRRFLHWPTRSQ